MSSKHQEFARRVLAAFADAGNHTDKEVGEAKGPSSTFMTTLRKAAETGFEFPDPRSDSLRRIDDAANWLRNSARDLWMYGTEPTCDATGALIGTRPPVRSAGGDPMDNYLRKLDARILELEERLDLVEMKLDPREEKVGTGDGKPPAQKIGDEAGKSEVNTRRRQQRATKPIGNAAPKSRTDR